MMNDGTAVKQRAIVLIPFPYANLNIEKKRPALILSNNIYNQKNEDVICCALSSNPREYAHSVQIKNEDLEQGSLRFESRAKATKLFTLHKKRIIKKLGKLSQEKSEEIVKSIQEMIKIMSC